MKKILLAIAATALVIPAAVEQPWGAPAYGQHSSRYDRHDRSGMYDRHGWYREPRRVHRGDNIWRGRDGHYYCRRDNGTTGLIIGAAGGAFVGRGVDTHGERATGTILGAALGALLGREIDRGDLRCR